MDTIKDKWSVLNGLWKLDLLEKYNVSLKKINVIKPENLHYNQVLNYQLLENWENAKNTFI